MFSDFVSHFEELRRRILISLVAVAILTLVSYSLSPALLDLCIRPLQQSGADLYFTRPYEAFLAHLKIACLSGIVLSSPLWISQAWFFAAPGLYQKEKRILLPLIFFSSLFFLLGVLFSYLILVPLGLRFLLSFQTAHIKPLLGVDAYFSFLIVLILTVGVLFDFPLVMIGLVRLGILRSSEIAKARKAVIVFLVILAAVLTPSPDPVTQLLLAVPLWVLYEISLMIARFMDQAPKP